MSLAVNSQRQHLFPQTPQEKTYRDANVHVEGTAPPMELLTLNDANDAPLGN